MMKYIQLTVAIFFIIVLILNFAGKFADANNKVYTSIDSYDIIYKDTNHHASSSLSKTRGIHKRNLFGLIDYPSDLKVLEAACCS